MTPICVNGIVRKQQRVATGVIVDCELGFNIRHRNVTAASDVESICNLRNIEVKIFHKGIKTTLAMVLKQLLTEPAPWRS
jgi:hypothetical protein